MCVFFLSLIVPDEAVSAGVHNDTSAEHPQRQGGGGALPERNGGGAEGRASHWRDGAQTSS